MTIVTDPLQIIDTLRKLQAIDDEIHDVRESHDAIVLNFDRLNKVLSHREEQLVEMRNKLTEAESWYKKKSTEFEIEQEKLAKAKNKLSGVSRSKEYVAVNRELDNIRRNLGNREDEIKRLSTAIEEFRATIESENAKVHEMRTLAETEANNNADALAEMTEKINAATDRRKAVSCQLAGGIVRRYDKIFKAREGVAVTQVNDGVCSGCNMVLQPRFIEQILRGSSLIQCPHCSRYLYATSTHNEDGEPVFDA